MLKELKILNGTLDLEFNEYIYEYTLSVKENINSLEFSYILCDNCSLNIRGNELNSKNNIVYLDIYNEENTQTYTFYVYKESSEVVSGIDDFVNSIELSKPEEISLYKVQLLSVGIFLVIIILFSIIFKKNKKLT